MVFVGAGVEHEALVELASMLSLDDTSSKASVSSKYEGGEIRHENGSDLAYVALAGPGAKLVFLFYMLR